MKRIVLTIALIAAVPAVMAYQNNKEETRERSCHRCIHREHRCHTCEHRERPCRTCESKWHPFRGSCERCNHGCNKNA